MSQQNSPSVVAALFDSLPTAMPAEKRPREPPAPSQSPPTIVVFDLETTELIAHGTPIEAMSVSVACALVLDAERVLVEEELAQNDADKIEVWPGLGESVESVEELLRAFDDAVAIVAHNAFGFDLRVLHRYYNGDEARFRSHVSKSFDSLLQLRRAGFGPPLSLQALLVANGFDGKTSDGVEAVVMWRDRTRHRELSRYCWQDVLQLAALLSADDGRLIVHAGDVGRFRGASLQTLAAARTGLTRIPVPDDPRYLEQGTAAWRAARARRVTGSLAASCLGVRDAFLTRQQAHDALRGDGSGSSLPAQTAAMRRGNELEAYARGAYERHTGRLVRPTGLHLHRRHPLALASSPDGIVLDDAGADTPVLLELKVPERGLGRGFGDAYQVQAAMHLLCEPSAQRVDFCTYVAANDTLVVKPVYRDRALERVLEEQLLVFWENAIADDDDEVNELDASELAELRMALMNAKAESVGQETVYGGMVGLDVAPYVLTRF